MTNGAIKYIRIALDLPLETRLILPKPLEPLRAELGIAHGVGDVAMPEVLLDRAGVVAVVRELAGEASGLCEPERKSGLWHLNQLNPKLTRSVAGSVAP